MGMALLGTACGEFSDKPSPYVPGTVKPGRVESKLPPRAAQDPKVNPDGALSPTMYGAELQD